jgi:hypothetical protein
MCHMVVCVSVAFWLFGLVSDLIGGDGDEAKKQKANSERSKDRHSAESLANVRRTDQAADRE